MLALERLDPTTLFLIALIVLCGSIVKGAVAFGFPLVATPLLASVIGPKEAVILVILPVCASNLMVLLTRRTGWDVVRRAAPSLVAAVPATIIGSLALAGIDPRPLALTVGALAFTFALLSVTRLKLEVPAKLETPIGAAIGMAGGLLQGATGISGPFVALYFGALGLTPRSFAYAVTLVFGLSGIVQFSSYVTLGLYTPTLFIASSALIPITILGQQIGFLIMDRLNPQLFKRVVVGVVALSSINLLLRGLGVL